MKPSNSSSTVSRHRGRVHEWRADKGFGFVQHGEERLFIHIRDFDERHVTPKPGDQLTYLLGTDAHGRPCAKRIVQHNDGGRLRPHSLLVLALLLVVPILSVRKMARPNEAAAIAAVAFLASLASYGLYAWDKHRAKNGDWRIPEKILHLWEFLGGWPGAFIAQRRLRHKSAKISYRLVFWLIVGLHQYAAIDWQLDWRLSRAAKEFLLSHFDADSAAAPVKSKAY
jgi:uncharacterized membrane protein YsdA (DUF1294 family)/cold shock CspA family protein